MEQTHSGGSGAIHHVASHENTRTRLDRVSTKEHRDPNLDINLPYRSLAPEANMAEYTTEQTSGEILAAGPAGGEKKYKLVTFLKNDPENPKNWSKVYKWYCTMVVALTCFVVAFNSAVITADVAAPAAELGVSEEVSLLAISVFVVGFGIGE